MLKWIAVSNAPEKKIHKFDMKDFLDKEKSRMKNSADAIKLIDDKSIDWMLDHFCEQ